MDTDFKVKVGQFEGPLDLLLDLIEKRKLHISEVTLSKVADEFVEYIKSFDKEKDSYVPNLADFILIASTLLLIKSRSLLPSLPLTEEEQGSIDDLEKRLADYKKYKELSVGLEKMFGNFLHFAREKKEKRIVFCPTPDITLLSLKEALQEALKNVPPKIAELPKVAIAKVVSLEEMIDKLSQRIEKSLRASFSDFAKTSTGKKDFSGIDRVEKASIIVSFLAMLELVKRGAVRVSQEKSFDDIQMESENTNVPAYF